MFSLLNMRSVSDDQTTKARIRDAAILRFAQDGLEAPLRSIASDAGVSAGLIMHHFGSRAGLRSACDDYVQASIRVNKAELMLPAGAPAAMLAQLAQLEGYTPLVGYVLRCLQSGGELTSRLVEGMVADTVDYLREGVRAGTVSPSRDEAARARLLTDFALGSLLLNLPAGKDPLNLAELPAWFAAYVDRILQPTLEVFTEPLLTDSTLLDAYLEGQGSAQSTERTTS
ncbi:TetR family transcriptional regulator [Citricoccus muralis]|uniref:TetR family transcriptional regulator n=2 Tax=Citricoccus muralis TaxID=169134 RepID=A0A3D9LB93_9MICC|nr:TetR family transcriptional regulator [Citricoccus muralis]